MFLMAFDGFLRMGEITSGQKVVNENILLFNHMCKRRCADVSMSDNKIRLLHVGRWKSDAFRS